MINYDLSNIRRTKSSSYTKKKISVIDKVKDTVKDPVIYFFIIDNNPNGINHIKLILYTIDSEKCINKAVFRIDTLYTVESSGQIMDWIRKELRPDKNIEEYVAPETGPFIRHNCKKISYLKRLRDLVTNDSLNNKEFKVPLNTLFNQFYDEMMAPRPTKFKDYAEICSWSKEENSGTEDIYITFNMYGFLCYDEHNNREFEKEKKKMHRFFTKHKNLFFKAIRDEYKKKNYDRPISDYKAEFIFCSDTTIRCILSLIDDKYKV